MRADPRHGRASAAKTRPSIYVLLDRPPEPVIGPCFARTSWRAMIKHGSAMKRIIHRVKIFRCMNPVPAAMRPILQRKSDPCHFHHAEIERGQARRSKDRIGNAARFDVHVSQPLSRRGRADRARIGAVFWFWVRQDTTVTLNAFSGWRQSVIVVCTGLVIGGTMAELAAVVARSSPGETPTGSAIIAAIFALAELCSPDPARADARGLKAEHFQMLRRIVAVMNQPPRRRDQCLETQEGAST